MSTVTKDGLEVSFDFFSGDRRASIAESEQDAAIGIAYNALDILSPRDIARAASGIDNVSADTQRDYVTLAIGDALCIAIQEAGYDISTLSISVILAV